MSATFAQMFSARAADGAVEIVGTFVFTGDGISLGAVEDAFLGPLRSLSQQQGAAVASEISQAHEAGEAAMRAAITDALERVAPEQRAELVERYGLAVGDVG